MMTLVRFVTGNVMSLWLVGVALSSIGSALIWGQGTPSENVVEAKTDATAPTTRPSADEMFRDNCIVCHQPPDSQFSTDRAWLDQIHRTA